MKLQGGRRSPISVRPIWEHTFVTHPAYIREKARQMRVEKDLTIDEIAERLAISRETIFYWVRGVPLRKPQRRIDYEARAIENSLRYKKLRDEAYEEGRQQYHGLIVLPSFRDFVCMYIGEGYKKNRNVVAICNSDLNVVLLGDYWIRRFTRNPIRYQLRYHADQDIDLLRRSWSDLLDIEPDSIRLQRKSNSNQLTGRMWRSRYGVLAVHTSDTYFRARLQAWMDLVTDEWLDWLDHGA
jgi:transcriptional regulator with XRE-family HTH domain